MQDDDSRLNTKTEIWLEYGECLYDEETDLVQIRHNIDLDCGGATFEEAIINLANKLYNHPEYTKYRDYKEDE